MGDLFKRVLFKIIMGIGVTLAAFLGAVAMIYLGVKTQ